MSLKTALVYVLVSALSTNFAVAKDSEFDISKIDPSRCLPNQERWKSALGKPKLSVGISTAPKTKTGLGFVCEDGDHHVVCTTATSLVAYSFDNISFARNDLKVPRRATFQTVQQTRSSSSSNGVEQVDGIFLTPGRKYVLVSSGKGLLRLGHFDLDAACEIPDPH